MAGERERHQELRRRPAEPHGHHHDDGDERGDGAVDSDQGGEARAEEHHQHEHPGAAVTGPRDQCCPAQAVTPVASSASLTTKSDAMKITVGSPNPASDWSSSSTPVAHNESATPTATTATGSRSR